MSLSRLQDPSLLRQQAFIAGEWADADSGKTTVVTNPANGERIGTIAMCGTAETQKLGQNPQCGTRQTAGKMAPADPR